MKAIGAEILDFWREWPPGERWYHDDAEREIAEGDGEHEVVLIDADEKYDLEDFGLIVWQGEGAPPEEAPARGEDYVSFEKWFKHWRKARTNKTVVVTVPNEFADDFIAYCKGRGFPVKS